MRKKKGVLEYVVNNTDEGPVDGKEQMWIGIEGRVGNQARKIDQGIATLRVQSG